MVRALYGLALFVALGICVAVAGPLEHLGERDRSQSASTPALPCWAPSIISSPACRDMVVDLGESRMAAGGGTVADASPASRRERNRCETETTVDVAAQRPPAQRLERPNAARPAGETTLELAERIASRFDLTITSGYRDPEHNAEVGGVEGSFHTRGTPEDPGAVDMAGSRADMRKALAWALANVPDLAEAMVHRICLPRDDGERSGPRSGGLHLHLAFSSVPEHDADPTGAKASAGDRFDAALDVIADKRAAGVLTSTEAARATITATSRALDGEYGKLTADDRRDVVATRREAQATVTDNARRKEAERQAALGGYADGIDAIDARVGAGEITEDAANALRLAVVDAALAGQYGRLPAADRVGLHTERLRLQALVAAAGPGAATQPAPVPPTSTPTTATVRKAPNAGTSAP